ncbi:unnamed protein product [Cuscuta campestris]|uniref:Uncharacterized protein n=1 Tax=Cuscuta campestris TaxID=132261 RepID=A0A484MZM2_9ASTE|nr:unnamed protein product [Cuscuta campestris]
MLSLPEPDHRKTGNGVVFGKSEVEGRKLLLLQGKTEFGEIKKVPAGQGLMDRVFKSLFVKGQVPASSPSKRGHADTVDEKLVARHLAALHRIPGSVPSPGTGN